MVRLTVDGPFGAVFIRVRRTTNVGSSLALGSSFLLPPGKDFLRLLAELCHLLRSVMGGGDLALRCLGDRGVRAGRHLSGRLGGIAFENVELHVK